MTHVNGTNRPFRSASTFAFANLQSYLMALSTQVIQTILHTVHDMCNSGWSKRAQASLHHQLVLVQMGIPIRGGFNRRVDSVY